MSKKLTPAAANIRATISGAMRTGSNRLAKFTPAPVTVIYGGGSTLPCPTEPVHPEPSAVSPTDAKCAAVRAACAAKALAQFKRNITRRATALKAAGAKSWPSFQEFVMLEGDGPHEASRCAEYLSTFPLPAKARNTRAAA
jgi:hypothetical protein